MGSDGDLFIYALCEPDGTTVRYIGCTRRPEQRLQEHISQARSNAQPNARVLWVRSVLAQGLLPALRVLSQVSREMASREECRLITEHLALGADLANVQYATDAPTRHYERPGAAWGQRLRALRLARMLTQVELAALLGVHATEVSHWETGRNLPRPGRQRQIVGALGLTPQEFATTDAPTGQSGERR